MDYNACNCHYKIGSCNKACYKACNFAVRVEPEAAGARARADAAAVHALRVRRAEVADERLPPPFIEGETGGPDGKRRSERNTMHFPSHLTFG